jgi:hypothetical protein
MNAVSLLEYTSLDGTKNMLTKSEIALLEWHRIKIEQAIKKDEESKTERALLFRHGHVADDAYVGNTVAAPLATPPAAPQNMQNIHSVATAGVRSDETTTKSTTANRGHELPPESVPARPASPDLPPPKPLGINTSAPLRPVSPDLPPPIPSNTGGTVFRPLSPELPPPPGPWPAIAAKDDESQDDLPEWASASGATESNEASTKRIQKRSRHELEED